MTPARGDLRAYRWVPNEFLIPFVGFDFSGDTLSMTMQVRLYPDAPGEPLIDLQKQDDLNAQGLSFTFSTVDGVTTSTLRIFIEEATIEALLPLPSGTQTGAEVELSYAVHIRSNNFPLKQRWLEGKFIVVPGANKA